tara:strand:- start:35 stop:295 length:261 start_codon:yes stop_codon:yes gene_type:complete
MKTIKKTKKNNKYTKLFNKYTTTTYLTLTQIKRLMKKEFKLTYNKNIMISFLSIWGTTVNNKRVITKKTFVTKLFKRPDGFFRDLL